jgi:hypothetical protein
VTTEASPPQIHIYDVANRLWETADELRANSHLKAAEYSIPVLGLIFLKFADSRFAQTEAELAGRSTGRRKIGKANYQAQGIQGSAVRIRASALTPSPGGKRHGPQCPAATTTLATPRRQGAPVPTREVGDLHSMT